MAQQQDEAAEKSHEPTQKKLDDARKKGDIAKSVEILTAGAYGGLLLAITVFGAAAISDLGTAMASIIERSDDLATLVFKSGGSATLPIYTAVFQSSYVWFVLPASFVLVLILAQQAFVVTGENLKPKGSRLSLTQNAAKKFGRGGLFEFFKSTVKLVVYSTILSLFLVAELPQITMAAATSPQASILLMVDVSVRFLILVLIVALVIGAIDFVFQRAEHTRKNRMTHKELRDETKESEGDPHLKQERRSRAQSIATNQMMGEVPNGDVVIVNPTHYAVVLKWSRDKGSAPECIAKGVDEVARQIRIKATEAGVPIHRDPPTARALHATVEIGQEIHPDHYRPVAAAIRFADAMRKKARERGTLG